MTHPQTAIVIGAGVAGMATAALLAREGIRTTVVEKLPSHGGRAGNESVDGFRFDTGPSWYLMPDAFDHFFALFGKRTEDVLDLKPLTPAYRLFPEGEMPIGVTSGRDNAIELFESIEPGAGATLREYLDSAEETYDLALEYFLYTTFRSLAPFTQITGQYGKLARYLTEPLDRFVASRFTDTRLRQMLTYPAVFLSSHPSRTPSMYHLMSHTDLVQGVQYPQGGFTAVMEALHGLATEQGAEIRLGAEVDAITFQGRRATGQARAALEGVQGALQVVGHRLRQLLRAVGEKAHQGVQMGFRFVAENLQQLRVEGLAIEKLLLLGFAIVELSLWRLGIDDLVDQAFTFPDGGGSLGNARGLSYLLGGRGFRFWGRQPLCQRMCGGSQQVDIIALALRLGGKLFDQRRHQRDHIQHHLLHRGARLDAAIHHTVEQVLDGPGQFAEHQRPHHTSTAF